MIRRTVAAAALVLLVGCQPWIDGQCVQRAGNTASGEVWTLRPCELPEGEQPGR